jgi:putative YphP/YqiW family bacilliredoxin
LFCLSNNICKTLNKNMYPEELVRPMRAELTSNGFTELKSADEVTTAMANTEGTTLVVVNSVCGCAAGTARPGVVHSLTGDKTPSNLYTVFAGQDKEATDTARSKMVPFPPSSPSIALFKDGELVHMVERHHIEGRSAEMIATNLQAAYQAYC